MSKRTKRVSVRLKPDAIKALLRLKDQCDPLIRALTSRIVSSAILFLDEQSLHGLKCTPHGVRPIPPELLAVNEAASTHTLRSRLSRPSLYLLPPISLKKEKHVSDKSSQ